jgi:hypothetical protein
MAAPDPARLTPHRRGRRFGLEIAALAAVGALLAHRHRSPVSTVGALAAIGGVLVLLAVARPILLAPIADWWMRVATRISRVTTPVLLTVVYLVVLTPMAWLRRTVGRSPIVRAPTSATFWVRRPQRSADDARASLDHQF